MFDYDGTLAPIVEDPNMAIPADRVVRTLKRLAQAPGNRVWIISGRYEEFLSEHLGHIEELGLSAEHGCFLRHPNSSDWENLAEKIHMRWQAIAEAIFMKYTELTSGSHVEEIHRRHMALPPRGRRAGQAQRRAVPARDGGGAGGVAGRGDGGQRRTWRCGRKRSTRAHCAHAGQGDAAAGLEGRRQLYLLRRRRPHR